MTTLLMSFVLALLPYQHLRNKSFKMSPSKVFICGATGTQGGALARQLRQMNWEIRTTVRDIESPAARALGQLGVEVVLGDWNDTAAMSRGLSGCQILFLNLYPDISDFAREVQQARNILQIAKGHGVRQVVYSSIFPIKTNDPLFSKGRECKREIEREVEGAGFESWTILRPGFFMANFLEPRVQAFPEATITGIITFPFSADVGLPLIDHEDIGKFAAAALQQPQRFHGAVIELVSEILPAEDAIRMLEEASGRRIKGRYLSEVEIKTMRESHNFFVARFSTVPQMASLVDIDQVKSWKVPLNSFEQFLRREREIVRRTFQCIKA